MAQNRYEGRYSPGANPAEPGPARKVEAPEPPLVSRFANRPARQVSVRARLLYVAALPMLVAGLREIMAGQPVAMAVELGCFAAFALGALLVNEGLRAEEAYNARTVAKPPAFPRKIAGALAFGLGTAAGAAFGWGLGLLPGLLFGLAAAAATLAAFGLDPMKSKGIAGSADFDSRRAAEAIDKAEAILAEMLEAARRFSDRGLEARVERFGQAARDVFRAVEQDPRDLDRARRFLGIYLSGARDATLKFAELHARSRDATARTAYEALLTDLETSFARHRQDLLTEDRGALDVEIEVLRKRLQQEGLA